MDLLLSSIASLGVSELGSILSSAGKNVIKNHKDANAWKKVFHGAGSAVLINDKQDEAFFKDLNDTYNYWELPSDYSDYKEVIQPISKITGIRNLMDAVEKIRAGMFITKIHR